MIYSMEIRGRIWYFTRPMQMESPQTDRLDLLALGLEPLVERLSNGFGKGLFHASALYRDVFKNGSRTPLESDAFSPRLARALGGRVRIEPGQVVDVFSQGDLTKFITRLSDGLKIESVIIPMASRRTLCVSSQVGCRMGCRFCQTARMGFRRSLTVSEITGQLFNARFELGADIKNVVFMGMGEPLDNFDNVVCAARIMNEQKGFDVAFRHITISTAGLTDGIRKLGRLNLGNIRLAVSVNSPDPVVRSGLMPVNRTHSLKALKTALAAYPLGPRGCFLLEYILIPGLNDSRTDARRLAEWIHPLPVRLNLIPYNPVAGFDHPVPDDHQMHSFADSLAAEGVFVVKRWSKGRSLGAGCGQLGRETP